MEEMEERDGKGASEQRKEGKEGSEKKGTHLALRQIDLVADGGEQDLNPSPKTLVLSNNEACKS